MPHVYRVSKDSGVGVLVDSIPAAEALVREYGPGRYQIDEHASEPFEASTAKARGWGTIIHQPDGRLAVKRFFFGDHVPVEDMES
jgi:hypothetical protein